MDKYACICATKGTAERIWDNIVNFIENKTKDNPFTNQEAGPAYTGEFLRAQGGWNHSLQRKFIRRTM